MTHAFTESLSRQALTRWAEIADQHPDLKAAIALQRSLLEIVINLAQELERATVQTPPLTPSTIADKLVRGRPVLRGEPLTIPQALAPSLTIFCDRLAEGGAGESARHIRDILAEGRIDGNSLLATSLARRQEAIRTSAIHLGLSPDLVWLVGELAASPLAHALQQRLLGGNGHAAGNRCASTDVQSALERWDRGYCPACGSWPALIEMRDGRRHLRCSFCAASWGMLSYRCIYCGDDSEHFVAAAPDLEQKDRRLELCGRCGSYTKVIGVVSPTPFPLVAIEDLATLDLDRAAMERGYARPPLVELDGAEQSGTPGGCQ